MPSNPLRHILSCTRTSCAVLYTEPVDLLSDSGVTDHGWSALWTAANRDRLKGGGDTAFIPVVQLLHELANVPEGAHPDTLAQIITDGLFEDRVSLRREHAYVMPAGTRLLFATSAPVFTIRAVEMTG